MKEKPFKLLILSAAEPQMGVIMKWLSVTKKDIKILLKDPSAIVVLLLLPIMFISIMSFALSDSFGTDDSPIEVLYVDYDQTEESENYIEILDEMEGLSFLSAEVDENEARALIDEGEYAILVVIQEGFSKNIIENVETELIVYTDAMQQTTSNIVEMAIAGASRQYELTYQFEVYGDAQGELTKDYITLESEKIILEIEDALGFDLNVEATEDEELAEEIADDIEVTMTEILDKPLISSRRSSNNNAEIQPDTFQQNVPGYTVMFAFFIILWAGKAFLNEKQIGAWDRIIVSNITTPGIYFGKFAMNFVIGIIQVFLLLAFGNFVFGMGLGSSIGAVVLLSCALITCSTSMGMLIASVSKSESQVVGLSLFLVLSTAALGGTMVPLNIMPDIMQDISRIVPQSWALIGYQNLFVRDQGIVSIVPNIAVLLGFSAVFFVISFIRIYKMRSGR